MLLSKFIKVIAYVLFVACLSTNAYSFKNMSFSTYEKSIVCEGCNIIYAEGIFTDNTADKFNSLISNNPALTGGASYVIFNSPGGALSAGISLGSLIKKYGFNTHIGEIVNNEDGVSILPGVCASSCAYAFLGGIKRSLSNESKYGLHQVSIQSSKYITLSNAVESTQDLIAVISRYVKEMGASSNLVSIGVEVPSNKIYWLTEKELLENNVINSDGINIQLPWEVSKADPRIWSVHYINSNGLQGHFTLTCKDSPKSGMSFMISQDNAIPEDNPYYKSYFNASVKIIKENIVLIKETQEIFPAGGSLSAYIKIAPHTLLDNKKLIISIEPSVEVSSISQPIPQEGLKDAVISLIQSCPRAF